MYMAEDWAKLCRWEHGQPPRPDLPYDSVGQNLYVTKGTFDALGVPQQWYDEVEYYNYDNGSCSGPACDHYTQVSLKQGQASDWNILYIIVKGSLSIV